MLERRIKLVEQLVELALKQTDLALKHLDLAAEHCKLVDQLAELAIKPGKHVHAPRGGRPNKRLLTLMLETQQHLYMQDLFGSRASPCL